MDVEPSLVQHPPPPVLQASAPNDSTDYKTPFLLSCLSAKILTFGTFVLKSGRYSPYFFNAGLLHSASLLLPTARAYAAILSSPPFVSIAPPLTFIDGAKSEAPPQLLVNYDVLFGPAYKGIPFAAATLTVLAGMNPAFENVSYAFNRKEAKDHGEGGTVVGCPLSGKRVVIIDDVITAGTALREAVGIIEKQGGKVVGVVLLLDREERVSGENVPGEEGGMSAVQNARKTLGVPVMAIVGLRDLIEVLGGGGLISQEHVEGMKGYRESYGARSL
jgi:orotate phosphoribosyltransferase